MKNAIPSILRRREDDVGREDQGRGSHSRGRRQAKRVVLLS